MTFCHSRNVLLWSLVCDQEYFEPEFVVGFDTGGC